jgi:hypothetical protein
MMDSRIKIKWKQTERSDGIIPVYIVVVEFGSPKAKVVEK